MERALSYNWNVYKVFKNGSRAKAPITTFECDEITMEEHFNNVIKKNFSGKFADAKYHIIRSDLPQEENTASEEEKFSKEKNRVLGRLVAQQKIVYKYGIGTALVYCTESDWRWQWAAVGAATTKYITGLSPKFNTYTEAQVWIQDLMELKSH
tara:strand:- start:409 stop:867 length:459 start_codon:yes stop_codon:yes gene_type:complete